jgi:hypothetical protein
MACFSGPEIVNDGLVFSVDFSNIKNINGTTLSDIFGYNVSLTNSGAGTLSISNGYAEFAPANLTSTATFYTISNTYFNTIASEISIDTVVYPIQNLGADGNFVRPVSPRITETSSPLGFGLGTDRIVAEVNTTTGWNASVTVTPQLTGYNKWYHITQTTSVATGLMNTYINSNLVRSQAFTGTPNGGGGFLIGRGFYAGTANFAGRVGYLKVYNRAISNNEISQNFEAIRGRYGI